MVLIPEDFKPRAQNPKSLDLNVKNKIENKSAKTKNPAKRKKATDTTKSAKNKKKRKILWLSLSFAFVTLAVVPPIVTSVFTDKKQEGWV